MLPNNTLLHHRYRIERLLAAGGMGAVYKARDERLNVIVAVKEALVSDPALLAAFQKEAQRLARLRHGALPNVMDHFVENYRQYLVMEYIEGEDLAEKLAKRGAPFSVDEVLGWGDQLLAVLEYLHGQQPPIIHRDIKPQNVKVMPDGTLILLDFGLAKGGLTQHSRSGSSVYGYTLGYAPLEQMMGHGTNAQSDLYSVSATLWNLLTAQQPVDARLREQAATHQMPDPLRPANELNPNVPPPLAQLLHHALALHSNQRPPDATTMRAMLRHERSRPQREAEAARRQAEEARRQAEVDKLQRELDAARRQAQHDRQQHQQAEAARRLAEAALRQAQLKRQQADRARISRNIRIANQSTNQPTHQPTIPPSHQLSPWNPLDHMRLLWWTLMEPQQLKNHRKQYGDESERPITKWLVSTLLWLPFFLPFSAAGLGFLPLYERLPEYVPSEPDLVFYLLISGGLFMAWLFTGIFGDRDERIVVVAGGLTGFIAAVLAGSILAGLGIGNPRWVVKSVPAPIGLVMGLAIGLGGLLAEGLARGLSLGLSLGLGIVLRLVLGNAVEESLKTGHASWKTRGVFWLLVVANVLLVWYSFLGGWQVFGE